MKKIGTPLADPNCEVGIYNLYYWSDHLWIKVQVYNETCLSRHIHSKYVSTEDTFKSAIFFNKMSTVDRFYCSKSCVLNHSVKSVDVTEKDIYSFFQIFQVPFYASQAVPQFVCRPIILLLWAMSWLVE